MKATVTMIFGCEVDNRRANDSEIETAFLQEWATGVIFLSEQYDLSDLLTITIKSVSVSVAYDDVTLEAAVTA